MSADTTSAHAAHIRTNAGTHPARQARAASVAWMEHPAFPALLALLALLEQQA